MNTPRPGLCAKRSALTSSSTTPSGPIRRWAMRPPRPFMEAALPRRPLTLTAWFWLVDNKRRGCGVGRSNSRHLARTIVPASPIQSRRPCSAGQLAGAPWHQGRLRQHNGAIWYYLVHDNFSGLVLTGGPLYRKSFPFSSCYFDPIKV